MLTVQSALPKGQVALWEKHPEHPGGEVFIADEKTHLVAGTQAVLAAVARNVLVIVPEIDVPVAKDPKADSKAGGTSRSKKEAEA